MKTTERTGKSTLAAENELFYFRLILAIGASAYLLFGIFYRLYVPGEIPMSMAQRIGASGFLLTILAVTYLSSRARERIELLMYLAISGAFSHLVYFAHVSGYKLSYALSILAVIIFLNFLFRGKIKLRWFNVAINLGVGLSIYFSADSLVNRVVYFVVLVAVSSLAYVLSRSKYLAEEEFEQLFEDSPVGLVRCKLDGKVLDYNREMLRLAGDPSEEEMEGVNIFDLLKIDGENLASWEAEEKQVEFPWGEKVWVDYSVELFPVHSKKPRDIIIACRDITSRKRAEDKIEYITYHDDLTDLYNRSFFQNRKDALGEHQYPLSVIFIDIDNLKLVNDAFGHQVGDRMLVKSAEVVRNSCRDDDLVFRWGGDEIVVLLTRTGREEGEMVLKRIRENTADSEFEPVDLSLSAGLAILHEYREGEGIDQVLEEAESRMYKNKMEGREEVTKRILTAITDELEHRSEPVMEHSRRLRELSVKLGEELGLKEDELEKLAEASIYHDIGKLTLEQKLLDKKYSELTDEEEEEMAAHAETGYQILKEIPGMADIAQIVLHHHEKWDGSGYPRGVKGEEIPYLSRVLSVANAYEYLTGEHYHPSKRLSRKEAIKELRRSAGSRYSPEIVEEFIEGVLRG